MNFLVLYRIYGLSVLLMVLVAGASVWVMNSFNSVHALTIYTDLYGEHWMELGLIIFALPSWGLTVKEQAVQIRNEVEE